MRFLFLSIWLTSVPALAAELSMNPVNYQPEPVEHLEVQPRGIHQQPEAPATTVDDSGFIEQTASIRSSSGELRRVPTCHTFSRPDVDHPIMVLLSDDPQFRFTRQQLRDIDRVLASVPPDFLQGITEIEARRYPDLPTLSDGQAPQSMKLAEETGGRITIYVPPMVEDVLRYQLLKHHDQTPDHA